MKTWWRAASAATVLAVAMTSVVTVAIVAETVAPAAAADIAGPAVVRRNVNVRGGPSPTAPVVGQLPGGSSIQVLSCNGPWCQIGWPGQAYVAVSYLDVMPVAVVQAPPPVPVAPAIVIAPPRAPLVYAAPPPVLYYPAPPRYYGPPPAPGPIYGGAPPSLW